LARALAEDAAAFPFEIERSQSAVLPDARKQLIADPDFGRIFSDHMATAKWTREKGWHEARISPRRPFEIDPACAVLHYAQEVFEGLKAYRAADGGITLFRPEQNARRLNASAARLAMPAVPETLFLKAIEELVRVDSDWIPDGDASLYLRPFMFASEAFLGVRPANEYLFCVIASLAGSYFKGGRKALSLWVSDDLNRAGPGGTGAAKCGGNYASSLASQAEAYEHGCDQVIFLDAVDHRWVDELGGMNIFFVFADGTVATPPLTGTILPGITRASIIELLLHRGVIVREEPYAVDQWQADATSGRLTEAFACGTAAVISSIGRVKGRRGEWLIGSGNEGKVADQLRNVLVAIQRGGESAPEGWVRRVAI
jgi:branched-chain amino acid aminotransferase